MSLALPKSLESACQPLRGSPTRRTAGLLLPRLPRPPTFEAPVSALLAASRVQWRGSACCQTRLAVAWTHERSALGVEKSTKRSRAVVQQRHSEGSSRMPESAVCSRARATSFLFSGTKGHRRLDEVGHGSRWLGSAAAGAHGANRCGFVGRCPALG